MSTTGLPPKESGYVTASCYDRNCTLAGIHERPIRQVRAWNSTIVNVSSFDTAKRIAPAAQKELLIGLRARTASVVISYNAAQAKVPLLVVKGLCSTYGTNSDRMRKKG